MQHVRLCMQLYMKSWLISKSCNRKIPRSLARNNEGGRDLAALCSGTSMALQWSIFDNRHRNFSGNRHTCLRSFMTSLYTYAYRLGLPLFNNKNRHSRTGFGEFSHRNHRNLLLKSRWKLSQLTISITIYVTVSVTKTVIVERALREWCGDETRLSRFTIPRPETKSIKLQAYKLIPVILTSGNHPVISN